MVVQKFTSRLWAHQAEISEVEKLYSLCQEGTFCFESGITFNVTATYGKLAWGNINWQIKTILSKYGDFLF